jgi:hypothetical protein
MQKITITLFFSRKKRNFFAENCEKILKIVIIASSPGRDVSFFAVVVVMKHLIGFQKGWNRGCQMVYFQNKKSKFCKFWMVLHWKMLSYIIVIWSILWPFDIFYCHLIYFIAIWYILIGIFCGNLVCSPFFGMLHQGKSGNPGWNL